MIGRVRDAVGHTLGWIGSRVAETPYKPWDNFWFDAKPGAGTHAGVNVTGDGAPDLYH